MKDLRVAVVGGSLTGPALAALLQKDGIEVKVFDRATAFRHTQGGGVIFLNLATLDVLDELGVDRHDYVDFPSSSEEVVEFKVLPDRRLTPGRTLHFPRQATQWGRVHAAVSSALRPGTVDLEREVVGVTRGAAWGTLLRFADGTWDWADVIVFADGRSSTGRRLLQPDRPLVYDGWTIHRGIVATPPPEEGHFVRFYVEQGLFNTYAVRLDDGTLGTYWEFDVNTTPDQFADEFGASPIERAFLLPSHVSQRSQERVRDLVALMLPTWVAELTEPGRSVERMAAPMFTVADPTQAVHEVGGGYAVLLGDALAPQFPMTGRGANDGFEEAASLAQALRQVAHHGADLDVALDGWQERVIEDVVADLAVGKSRARARHLGGGELPLDLQTLTA